MSIRVLMVVAALGCVVGAATALTSQQRVVMETAPATPPDEWHGVGAAGQREALTLVIAVRQSAAGRAALEDTLLRVSDPDNAAFYGKHLSLEEVDDLVAPTADSVRSVMAWLTQHGVDATRVEASGNSDFLTVHVTVAQAEALLGARYYTYTHHRFERATLRLAPGTSYSLPASVAAHVDFVSPTARFPTLEPRISSIPQRVRAARNEEVLAAHGSGPRVGNSSFIIVPGFLRQLYQATGASGSANVDNVQSVTSFIQQFYSPDDLAEFYDLFFPSMKGHKIAKQVGKNDPSNVGAEAALDTQYLSSVGSNVTTWVWYNGNADTPFLAWLLQVGTTKDIPNLFSVSYGEYENGITRAYAERVNVEMQKLGARGVSVMIAAGDSGAGGNCSTDGRFSPDFPASSPWVTTVGGMVGGDAGKTPTGETVDYIGGGGFSDFFPRPSYQANAVEEYLTNCTKLPPAKNFNRTGRAYPDIAAQSEGFSIVVDLVPLLGGVGGTSCATPTSGAIFSLLNERRIAAGKSALGFLNPLIYKTAPMTANSFNDATYGANGGCNSFDGFTAIPGWDAASGWGSPNYRILSSVVDQLP